jgi:hypothetical protein
MFPLRQFLSFLTDLGSGGIVKRAATEERGLNAADIFKEMTDTWKKVMY